MNICMRVYSVCVCIYIYMTSAGLLRSCPLLRGECAEPLLLASSWAILALSLLTLAPCSARGSREPKALKCFEIHGKTNGFGSLQATIPRKHSENKGLAPRKGQRSLMGPFANTGPTRIQHGSNTDIGLSGLELLERLGSLSPDGRPRAGRRPPELAGWPAWTSIRLAGRLRSLPWQARFLTRSFARCAAMSHLRPSLSEQPCLLAG